MWGKGYKKKNELLTEKSVPELLRIECTGNLLGCKKNKEVEIVWGERGEESIYFKKGMLGLSTNYF